LAIFRKNVSVSSLSPGLLLILSKRQASCGVVLILSEDQMLVTQQPELVCFLEEPSK
jgi:hypothetical protein